jgi:hypothetical protein
MIVAAGIVEANGVGFFFPTGGARLQASVRVRGVP